MRKSSIESCHRRNIDTQPARIFLVVKYGLLVAMVWCSSMHLAGQTTAVEYFDLKGDPTSSEASYYFYVGVKNSNGYFYDSVRSFYSGSHTLRSIEIWDQFGNRIGEYESFYPNRILKMKGRYERKHFKMFQSSPDTTELTVVLFNDSLGNSQVKNSNGFIRGRMENARVLGKIVNGVKDSLWTTYYENGKPLCLESWHDGELVDGISFDPFGKEYYYKSILVLPEPPEGTQEFYDRMGDDINYPKEAQKRGIEGKILVTFMVEANGVITSPGVKKGLGFGTDAEVIRIIANSKPWIPARQRGQPIRHEVTLPFIFKLK